MTVPPSSILRDPETRSGIACFTGTRVPVSTLMDYLKAGDRIDDFLDDFPTVDHERVATVLQIAGEAVTDCARSACNADAKSLQSSTILHALVPNRGPWDTRFVAKRYAMEKQTLALLDSALEAVRRDLSPRVEELSQKNTAGTLAPEEMAEYSGIVRLNDNLALLRLQAEELSTIRAAS